MEQLSFEEAIRLSIKKWKLVAKHGWMKACDKISLDNELSILFANCGMCERYKTEVNKTDCTQCEFSFGIEDGCNNLFVSPRHPYRIFSITITKKEEIEQAKIILELLKNLKPKQDEK